MAKPPKPPRPPSPLPPVPPPPPLFPRLLVYARLTVVGGTLQDTEALRDELLQWVDARGDEWAARIRRRVVSRQDSEPLYAAYKRREGLAGAHVVRKRTAKDEADYLAHLRREEPIKTEVIVQLRDYNKQLLRQQADLLQALLAAEDALRTYRSRALDETRWAVGREGDHCVPGCRRHQWDTVTGWVRADQERTS